MIARRRILCASLILATARVGGGMAGQTSAASEEQAKALLIRELPKMTLGNPKYVTKSDGTISQWLTDALRFSRDAAGRLQVQMIEHFTQNRGGVSTTGEHEATFSLADVNISDFTQPGDETPTGEAARGVLFTCVKAGCVAAVWSGQASRADKTDISIQDDASRARVLAAFLALKSHSR